MREIVRPDADDDYCDFYAKFPDGQGGAVLKPNSDTQPVGVFVAPGGFRATRGSALNIRVKGKVKVVSKLRFRNEGNPDANGNRQNWDFKARTNRLARFNIVRLIRQSDGARVCWPIKNQRKRID